MVMRRALEALLSASDSKTAAILTPYNAQLRFINGLLRRVGRRHQVGWRGGVCVVEQPVRVCACSRKFTPARMQGRHFCL